MGVLDQISEHEEWLALDWSLRPALPANPADSTAADSVAYKAWEDASPRRANLMGADLRSLDLSGRDLRMAGLRGCDLRNADLRNANLEGADLRDCQLESVNLVGATIDSSTRIGGVTLGAGLDNRTSLILLLEAVGGDPEETQAQALIEAIESAVVG